MTTYSDDKLPQTNIIDYLPEVYRSDVNQTLTHQTFDRFFSKDDTEGVSGYIGTGNPNSVINRQLQETSTNPHEQAHRQAFQLAPTMYSKIGTEESALSYKNFLKQLEMQGVDISRLPLWANTLEFNWVPPINIDMLVNYQDYFWGADNIIESPQYLTIENRCRKSTDRLTAYSNAMLQRGVYFPIIAVDFVNNAFILHGNNEHIFTANFTFNTITANTINLNNKSWSTSSSTYNSIQDQTVVIINEPISASGAAFPIVPPYAPAVGEWFYNTTDNRLYEWDSVEWIISTSTIAAQIALSSLFPIVSSSFANNTFSVSGKQDDIFIPGFVFFTKDTTEINIKNKFWTTVSSVYDITTYTTIITLTELLAVHSEIAPTPTDIGQWYYNPTTNILYVWDGITWNVSSQLIVADVSLSELVAVFQTELNCICTGGRGWDIGLWDDNSIGDVAWNTTLLTQISFSSEALWIVANTNPPNPLDLWYDTTLNQLKQYGDLTHPLPSDPLFVPSWNTVVSNFSAVLDLTTARERWDLTVGCNPQEMNQWTTENIWKHKTSVESFASAKRAQLPILEYDSNLELNNWTKTHYSWKYRKVVGELFNPTLTAPSRFELEPIKGYQTENVGGVWYLYLFDNTTTMNANINLTDTFVSGYRFRLVDDINNSAVYTVQSSEYRSMQTSLNPNLVGNYMVTVVILVESFTSPLSGGINNSRLIPITTGLGDMWLGYQTHWVLDMISSQSSPSAPQPLNLFRDNITASDSVSGNGAYTGFLPQVSIITYGNNFQEFTVDIPNIHEIDLVSSLLYSPSLVNSYATPGSNELRVYINNIRQYGTYVEVSSVGNPGYTAVGTSIYNTQTIPFVTGIIFDSSIQLNTGDIVRLAVGPASLYDMGMYSLPVRTIEDDADFSLAAAIGTQPIYMSLTTYELTEQKKTTLNQYPLFDVYNLLTGDLVLSTPIISFVEDQSFPVNVNVGRRLLTSDGEISIKQHLLDHDDALLFGYRDTSLAVLGVYWYSPHLQTVQQWDGDAWTNKIIQTTANGIVLRTPKISNTDPVELWSVDQALWLNTNTNKLYCRNMGTWVEETLLVVSEADPTIRTIWRHGLSNEQYIPQYVDKNRVTVPTTNADADWEVVKQWTNNPEHLNKSILTLTQVATHFRSIIQHQQPTPGLIGGGAYTKLQSEYNYGLGGTIKEFNGAFDTLISSVAVTNTTPLGVMEFAAHEYDANIRFLRDIFNKSIIDLCINYNITPETPFATYLVNSLITLYENNDYANQIYGDTSAYNNITKQGVKNWIATAPMFGLTPLYLPHMIVDGNWVQIFNHDGHRTNVIYTLAEEDAISRKIISKLDIRTNTPIGVKGPTSPPQTVSTFLSTFGGSAPRIGVFWYDISNPHTLYRFEIYTTSSSNPSLYINGVEAPDGILYYNTTTNNTFVKVGLSWVEATAPGSADISPMWKVIDLQHLLGTLYLEVETRLHDVSVGATPAFDYTTLTPNPAEQSVYSLNYKKRFDEYVIDFSVSTPYANTQYSQVDPFTWNYLISTIVTPPHNAIAPTQSSCWQLLYTNWYGTPYPHREPWVLQGYTNKPTWWDDEYLQTNGTRTWIFNYAPVGSTMGTGMWENIRIGHIPATRTYPNGMISTGNSTTDGQTLPVYNYFSVNISNSTINGSFAPDDLLPPYYSTLDSQVRSIFTSLSQVIAPYADYVFGDGSVIEWQWMVSAQYPYEKPIIAYLMQPVKFLRNTFGPKYMLVDGLEVDTILNQVYSHTDALFHGDIYNSSDIYESKGLNQWYVNFNRYTGYDTSGDFRQVWVGWKPLLTYQSNGILDTSTLDISHHRFDVAAPDYNVIIANNGTINDLWVDAFNVTIIYAPPSVVQYNNQSKWKLELNSLANVARTIQYYDIKSYQFNIDVATDLCHPYMYNIVSVDSGANRLYVGGDQSDIFILNTSVDITQSLSDGVYTVVSSVYEPGVDMTRINILESLTVISGGVINVGSFALPWSTGDSVILSTTKNLPAPLVTNTPYYIVTAGNQSFQLAETFNDAISNVIIDLKSIGSGSHTVSEISSSFHVMGKEGNSQELWYHHTVDKGVIRTLSLPSTISGMQTLINIMDGYAAYQTDVGVIYNTADSNDFDYNTGRLINWGVEVERFIDWAYGLRRSKVTIADRYEYTVNTTDNTITFVNMIPSWNEGTAVQFSTSGSFPAPLDSQSTYYVVTKDQAGVELPTGTIKLSISKDIGYSPFWVDLTTPGSGREYIATKGNTSTYPRFEINPNRNNVWVDTPTGIVSSVVEGPYTDIRVRQTIFDQYGRALGPNQLLVYRQDERTRVAILPQIANDVDRFYNNDPYNYIHLGGGHFFVEGYEHFIIFKPYTVGGDLVYDSFLGVSVSKFEVALSKKSAHTLRPTLSGYYMNGNAFHRNIEGAASDLANFYDIHKGSNDPITNQHARALLGYTGTTNYLNMLGINAQSQFMFYRGMLNAKGSVAGVLAYINSRKFTDANIDEFWAIKEADFGDRRLQVYPEILLKDLDNVVDDIRFEFVGIGEDIFRSDIQYAANSKGFKIISFADETRWNNFPTQRVEIEQPLFLDATTHSLSRVFVSTQTPPDIQDTFFEYWYNPTSHVLKFWSGFGWENTTYDKVHNTTNNIYWRHEDPCDDVRVVRHSSQILTTSVAILRSTSIDIVFESPNTFVVVGDITKNLSIDGTTIVVSGSTSNNGSFTVQTLVYNQSQNVTYISVNETLTTNGVGGVLTYDYYDFSVYDTTSFTPAESGANTYFILNSEAVRISGTDFHGIVHIYTIRPSYNSINPAKLVAKKTNSVVDQITLWHPAFGWNYYIANHNIDLYNNTDPAQYSENIQPSSVSDHFWNFAEVGKTWLDTSVVNYIPYYDESIYSDINDRLGKWGELAPYAAIRVYQWVRSTVPPSEWATLAQQQQADITIPQDYKVSGTAKTTLFKRTRSIIPGKILFGSPAVITIPTHSVNDSQSVFLTSVSDLPTELQDNTSYYVASASNTAPQTFVLRDIQTDSDVDIVGMTTTKVSIVNIGNSAIEINVVQTPKGIVADGDTVAISTISAGVLPGGLVSSVEYIVADVSSNDITNEQTFNLVDPNTNLTVTIVDNGAGPLTLVVTSKNISVVPSFDQDSWVKQVYAHQRIFGAWLSDDTSTVTEPDIIWSKLSGDYKWYESDSIEIYQNGVLVAPGVVVVGVDSYTISSVGTGMVVHPQDYIDIVRPIHTLTESEISFNPDINDDGVTLTQWKTSYEYSQSVVDISPTGTSTINYYFWVEGSTIKSSGASIMSSLETHNALLTMPDLYLIVQKPMNTTPITGQEILPIAYREAIIRNLSNYINNTDQYMIQFNRDLTLRDNLTSPLGQGSLKNKHEEWVMIRQNQNSNIPRNLWDKATESLVGQLLNGGSPIPSLDRVLYDSLYGTVTRYGLGVGQAFVDRTIGMQTLVRYLSDPARNFAPIDMDVFLNHNTLTTPGGIISAMNEIYTTFNSVDVNGIWFELLQDALTTNLKYKGLMKTSWVAIRVTRLLEVGGLFDD